MNDSDTYSQWIASGVEGVASWVRDCGRDEPSRLRSGAGHTDSLEDLRTSVPSRSGISHPPPWTFPKSESGGSSGTCKLTIFWKFQWNCTLPSRVDGAGPSRSLPKSGEFTPRRRPCPRFPRHDGPDCETCGFRADEKNNGLLRRYPVEYGVLKTREVRPRWMIAQSRGNCESNFADSWG